MRQQEDGREKSAQGLSASCVSEEYDKVAYTMSYVMYVAAVKVSGPRFSEGTRTCTCIYLHCR